MDDGKNNQTNLQHEKIESSMSVDPTYWKRVRYAEDLIARNERPWRLKYVENQGYTAFATRSYKAGELILTEFPVVWIHGHHPFTADQVEEIDRKISALSEEDSAAFFAMANVFPESEYPKAVGIFMTNCFDMTDSIYGTSCAMYLALARLNHSCVPNVQQTHLPDTTEEVVYATRDIAEGEEINDCYIELRENRQKRRSSLLEYYRFTCMCIACNINEEKIIELNSDDRLRVEAANYEETIIAMIEEEDQLQAALEYGLSMVNKLEQPSALLWSIRFLPEAYHMIYQIYQTLAQVNKHLSKQRKEYEKQSIKYLKKCVKLNQFTQGDRSPDTIRTAMQLQQHLSAKNNNTIK